MRRLSLVTILLLLVLALPTWAAPKKGAKTVIDSDKLRPNRYTGTLMSVPGSDGFFTLQIKQARIGGTGGAGKARGNAQQIQRAQQQLIRQRQQQLRRMQQQARRAAQNARRGGNRGRGRGRPNFRRPNNRRGRRGYDPRQAQRIMQQIQRQRQQAVQRVLRGNKGGKGSAKISYVTYDIDFQTDPRVRVRAMKPPQAFDEKGNIKTYTRAELAKLKGTGADARLPGYQSSVEQLQPGMVVQVTLVARGKPRGAAAVEADGKRNRVTMIMIVSEGNGDLTGKKGKKKKK